MQRQRKVTGAGFAQTLVFGGIVQPDATRWQQHQHAIQVGMRLSVQGLEQRFSVEAVRFMQALLEAGLEQMVSSPRARPLLPQFNGVYITDCTRMVWGKQGMKMGVRWELQHGQLQVRVSALTENDQRSEVLRQAMPAGALHLGDLGFFKLSRFRDWNEQGVYWLSRFKVGTLVETEAGEPLDVWAYLQATHTAQTIPVRVGGNATLPAYLVTAPLPDDGYNKRFARLKEQARLDQRPLSRKQAAFAPWTFYLTNVPDLTFEQAHTLNRTRWQIELLFKLWKSHGKVLVSRSSDPLRQQCEGYAKLLGVLIFHWLLLVTGWGWHNYALSALDAFRVIRSHLPVLMRAFVQPALWHELLLWLHDDLLQLPPLSKRRTVPLAFQLWQDFDLVLP